jgi:CheY-like chemotaxis protein
VAEILIIEDTESDALLLERILRNVGVSNPIRRLITGGDALLYLNAKEQALPKGDPTELAVVFCDLKLPDFSGFEVLTILTQRKVFSSTLKVVVSELGNMENIRKAYTLGADSFITKPPSRLDIIELIRSFPENWALADQPQQTEIARPEEDRGRERYSTAWARNREVIERLRQNIQALKTQLADNTETLAIMEALADELRAGNEAVKEQPPRSGL